MNYSKSKPRYYEFFPLILILSMSFASPNKKKFQSIFNMKFEKCKQITNMAFFYMIVFNNTSHISFIP